MSPSALIAGPGINGKSPRGFTWGIISIYSNVLRVLLDAYLVSAAEPFQGSRFCPSNPRVGSVLAGLASPRQPWAGGRNPVGIAGR